MRILQVRVLKWVAMPSSGGSSQLPSCLPRISVVKCNALVFMTDMVYALICYHFEHLLCYLPLNSSHPLLHVLLIYLNKKA